MNKETIKSWSGYREELEQQINKELANLRFGNTSLVIIGIVLGMSLMYAIK